MADDGFRKPPELDVTEGLDRPNLSVRQFDADDEHEKAAKVADKAHHRDREILRELEAAANEAIRQALQAPRPDRDATAQKLEEAVEEVFQDWKSHRDGMVGFVANRAGEAGDEMPELTSGKAAPGESDTRRWIREADDPNERQQRLRAVVESGNVAQARALFRASVPAQAAGFADEGQRRRMLEDALRSLRPVAYETNRSLTKELEVLTHDGAKVEQYAEKLREKAMQTFDRVVAQHAAAQNG